jgi:hypothetical protein
MAAAVMAAAAVAAAVMAAAVATAVVAAALAATVVAAALAAAVVAAALAATAAAAATSTARARSDAFLQPNDTETGLESHESVLSVVLIRGYCHRPGTMLGLLAIAPS